MTGYTQKQAAELLDVPVRLVRAASVVLRRGCPELIAAVDAGQVHALPAARLARKWPWDVQRILLDAAIHLRGPQNPPSDERRPA